MAVVMVLLRVGVGRYTGGFTQTVLREHRDAEIGGITLPSEMGGLPIMLPRWR
jgi:hypothetical protein